MKTYKDYLIDFDTLKVGDKIWSPLYGYGVIKNIVNTRRYPIDIQFEKKEGFITFNENGLHYNGQIMSMLFSEKPDFFKDKKEVKRWRWYYEFVDNGLNVNGVSRHLTDEEVLLYFKENFKENQITGYGTIPCTETTDVVYE